MPLNSPLITVPTARPRAAGSANSAAKGTICCAVDPPAPTSADATMSVVTLGASAAPISASTVAASCHTITARRLSRSPSGSRNRMPAAKPSCVAVGMAATACSLTPKLRAISPSIGWLYQTLAADAPAATAMASVIPGVSRAEAGSAESLCGESDRVAVCWLAMARTWGVPRRRAPGEQPCRKIR
jgi:hypothetical protein